ncbi:hypothetical protein PACTADRAFT_48752 [Pachysolen tannophilus NRRL Y-2460]|uniref:MPN domain-containing protein n=1 Tax=Pachysolen tannophilus NRRL Y-2460 TaxID=669874 RepID=A0A1E4TZ00_PACTA|nr:hypothetical protein PACTADRAFT_48752 [Pachysolen tannophilus NRRL Y-2460]
MSKVNIELEASVALKIVKNSSDHYPHSVSGPLFGIDLEEDSNTKKVVISHVFSFPNNNSNSNDHHHQEGYSFKLKSNLRFQNEVLDAFKETGLGVKFVGLYLSSIGGRYLTQQVVDSMMQQQALKNENDDNSKVLLLVHDPSKTKNGVLSLRIFKLSEVFVKTCRNGKKFQTTNLIENGLTFKNVLEELPLTIHNSHLVNLKILSSSDESKGEENFESLKLSSTIPTVETTIESLFDSIDDFNYDQNNFNYYQRSLSRELAKINQWKQKRKLENLNKLKQNPNTPESELLSLDESEWSKHFKLPSEPSRYENLIISGLLNNFCNELEVSSANELIKSFSVAKGLDIN